MAFGWDDAALVGLMLGEQIYFRWFQDKPKPQPATEVTLPRVDDGASYSIIYGTCRTRTPVVAWCDKPLFAYHQSSDVDGMTYIDLGPGLTPNTIYFLSMHLVLGIPFDDGKQQLLAMWAGDALLVQSTVYADRASVVPLSSLLGDGSDYQVRLGGVSMPDGTNQPGSFGAVEFLNGNSTQKLVDVGSGTVLTELGGHMTLAASYGGNVCADYYGSYAMADIPGYRGFLSVFLHNQIGGVAASGLHHWVIGDTPAVPQYSFEVRSLPATWLGPAQTVPLHDGDITRETGDVNPMDVAFDVLTGKKGKCGLDPSRIDIPAFRAAATTLYNEGNGYSNSIENGKSARDILDGIEQQCDCIFFEDPVTGLITIKMIRPDFDPNALQIIDPSNCKALQNFASSANTDIPNSVRISFPDREKSYNDNSGAAHDEANAAGNGQLLEIQLRMDGVRQIANANAIADRELAARCRSVMKFRALVSQDFRNAKLGDPYMVNWPKYQLSNVVMRVAAVNRGTPENPTIALDLIQDYFYVWRSRPPEATTGVALKTPGSFTFGR